MTIAWTEFRAPDGRPYWFNSITQKSTWEKPAELKTPFELIMETSPWKEFTAPDGRRYWHNVALKTSTWEIPEDHRLLLEKAKAEQDEYEKNHPTAAADTTTAPSPPSLQAAVPDVKRDIIFTTFEEAEAAFLGLLEETNVGTDWTWEQCMRAIIHRPLYKALHSVNERRAAFEKYVMDKRIADQIKERDRVARLQVEFKQLLVDCPGIKPASRFSKAQLLFSEHPAWKLAKDDRERREIFDEHINNLRREVRDREKTLWEQNQVKFRELIPKISGLTECTSWEEFSCMLKAHPEYVSDEELQQAHPADVIPLFEDYIKHLEKIVTAKRRSEKENRARSDCLCREAFMALLAELCESGRFHVDTKWKELYPLVHEDARFTAMLGLTGSTPLDLYRDVVLDLEEELYRDRKLAQEIIKGQEFVVGPETTRDAFMAAIRFDGRHEKIQEKHFPLIYDILIERAVEKQKEERRRQERKLRHAAEDFKYLLKKQEVTASMAWEEVRARLAGRSAYEAVPSDELRQEWFQKYVDRLREKAKERKRRDRSVSTADSDRHGHGRTKHHKKKHHHHGTENDRPDEQHMRKEERPREEGEVSSEDEHHHQQ